MNEKLKSMMDQRRQALGLTASAHPPSSVDLPHSEKSFGVHAPEGYCEHLIDFRFQNGNRVAFAYSDLIFLNFEQAESRLDLNFRGYQVSIYGRNLEGDFYEALMDRRVRWVMEIASPSKEYVGNDVVVVAIEITPPGAEFDNGDDGENSDLEDGLKDQEQAEQ